MSHILIEKPHIKQIRNYLKQSKRDFKKSQARMQKSNDLIGLTKNINQMISERNELYAMFDLFVHTLEQLEKYNSKK